MGWEGQYASSDRGTVGAGGTGRDGCSYSVRAGGAGDEADLCTLFTQTFLLLSGREISVSSEVAILTTFFLI